MSMLPIPDKAINEPVVATHFIFNSATLALEEVGDPPELKLRAQLHFALTDAKGTVLQNITQGVDVPADLADLAAEMHAGFGKLAAQIVGAIL